jgi:hypothetical protein
MAIPIPPGVRELLSAPNHVHPTLRADGSPRNWVVWVGLEDDYFGFAHHPPMHGHRIGEGR